MQIMVNPSLSHIPIELNFTLCIDEEKTWQNEFLIVSTESHKRQIEATSMKQ